MTLQLTDRMLAHVDDHGIGWMTFNNPSRHNALSLEMWQGISDILKHFQSNDAVQVVVMPKTVARPLSQVPTYRVRRKTRLTQNVAATVKLAAPPLVRNLR